MKPKTYFAIILLWVVLSALFGCQQPKKKPFVFTALDGKLCDTEQIFVDYQDHLYKMRSLNLERDVILDKKKDYQVATILAFYRLSLDSNYNQNAQRYLVWLAGN